MCFSRTKIFGLLTVFLLVCLTGCLHKTDLPLLTSAIGEQKPILITNATVFTGNPEDDILEQASILIEDGIIVEISTTDIQAPDAQVIDARGNMVLPGLIDSHIHVFGSGAPPSLPALPNPERNVTAFLYAGITTVVDMGGPVEDLEALSVKIADDEIAGPRFVYAGRMFTCEDGHPAAMVRRIVPWLFDEYIISRIAFEVEDGDDVRPMILENKAHGAGFSKLAVDEIPLGIPTLSTDQVRKIVENSRAEGFTTVAHIGSEDNIVTALDGGVRVFNHGPYRSALSDATVQRMKETDCIVTPTVAVFDNIVRYGKQELEFSVLDREIADPVILAEYQKPPTDDTDEELAAWVKNAAEYQEIKFENVIKMKAAGIPLLAGSDSINVASSPGATLHRELELLVEHCGFTPIEAVAAATYLPGKLYSNVTGQPRVGYLQEGLPADLLILKGDFRDDIRQTQYIDTIVLDGKIVERRVLSRGVSG